MNSSVLNSFTFTFTSSLLCFLNLFSSLFNYSLHHFSSYHNEFLSYLFFNILSIRNSEIGRVIVLKINYIERNCSLTVITSRTGRV